MATTQIIDLASLTRTEKEELANNLYNELGYFGLSYYSESDIQETYQRDYSDYIEFGEEAERLSTAQLKAVKAKIEKRLEKGFSVDGEWISQFIVEVVEKQ